MVGVACLLTAPGAFGRAVTVQVAPADSTAVRVAPAPAAVARPMTVEVAAADSTPPARVVFESPARIPIELDRGMPMLTARVNGRGPFRFGIETGGRLISISPALAESLALPKLPNDSLTVHVDSISIGPVRFEDLHVTPLAVSQPNVDGLLGLPAFESVRLTIDYPDSAVVIERGQLPGPGGDIMRLQRVGPFWGVPITIGQEHWVAIIDTRSGGGLGFTPNDTTYMAWETPLREVGQSRGAQIPLATVFGGKMAEDVRMGRHVFTKPFVTVRPLPPGFPQNPILGSRALMNFVFTLDQINGFARFSREGSAPIVLPEPRRMVVGGTPTPNGDPAAGEPVRRVISAPGGESSKPDSVRYMNERPVRAPAPPDSTRQIRYEVPAKPDTARR